MGLVAMGLAGLVAIGISQEIGYDGRRLPAEQRLPWSGREQQGTSMVVDGEALRISDDGTAQGQLLLVSYPWSAEAAQPHRVEAEVKVLRASGPAGVILLAADGVHEAGLSLYPDRIELHRLDLRQPVKLDDDFHRVTLIMRGNDLVVQVDGRTLIDLTGKSEQAAHEGRNLVGFGSLSSPATGEAIWRSVRATVEYPAVTVLPGTEQVVVYRQEGVYACFPSLYNLGDTLVASFGTRVRRSHLDSTGGSARMLSRDGGRTWQPAPADLVVVAPWAKRADGGQAVAGAVGWREAPAEQRAGLEAKGWEVREVRPGVVAYAAGAQFSVRGGDGQTIRPATPIEVPPHRLMMGYNQSAYLNLGQGVRLVAIYGENAAGGRDAYVLRTTDDGNSWECRTIARGTTQLGFNEPALGVNARGEVIALLRTAETPKDRGYLYQSVSTDGGLTWSEPTNTGMWGYPANLLLAPDGRLVATYGYRRAPMGIRATISRDGGRSWETERTMVLRADGAGSGSDLGYPITTLLADGTLLTIYYFNDAENVTHIAATRWQLPTE